MTSRALTSAIATAIAAETAEFVHLLELTFSSGTVRLTTGTQDLSWNSVTWQAVGGLLEFSGIEETNDHRGQGVDITLSGVDQTLIAILLGAEYRGRPVKIYRAHLNPVLGTVIADPILLFQGLQLSQYTIEEEHTRAGGTVRITTRLSGYFGAERIRGIVTNVVSHQSYFPGDTFFSYTFALANAKIYWGSTKQQVNKKLWWEADK